MYLCRTVVVLSPKNISHFFQRMDAYLGPLDLVLIRFVILYMNGL